MKCSDWHPLEILDFLQIYCIWPVLDISRLPFKSEKRSPHLWCFALVPSAQSVKEHTGWTDGSCILSTPCSRCCGQNIEIRAYRWVSLRLSGQYIQTLSNTCQAVDFWWGLMSVFEQHLKKLNYKWHIWESALKPRNCRKISGTAWPKANHAFKTLIIWHSVNDAARPALPFRRWWIWHTSEGQSGNERLPTNSHSSKTWGKLK